MIRMITCRKYYSEVLLVIAWWYDGCQLELFSVPSPLYLRLIFCPSPLSHLLQPTPQLPPLAYPSSLLSLPLLPLLKWGSGVLPPQICVSTLLYVSFSTFSLEKDNRFEPIGLTVAMGGTTAAAGVWGDISPTRPLHHIIPLRRHTIHQSIQ